MFSPEEAKKEYMKHKFIPADQAIVIEVTFYSPEDMLTSQPAVDISYFTKMFSPEEAMKEYMKHKFNPADQAIVIEIRLPIVAKVSRANT